MASISAVTNVSSVSPDPVLPEQPGLVDWLLLVAFIPFSAWVLWTSWKWRRERRQSR